MHEPRSARDLVTRSGLAAAILVLVTSCGGGPPADPAYVGEIEAWQQRRIAGIGSPDGWLTVIDLVWLRPGVSRIGGASDGAVVLPGDDVPAVVAELDLSEDGSVFLRPLADSGLMIDDEPATGRRLKTDREGRPIVMQLGTVSFFLIERGGQIGVRVKDSASEARRNFKGLVYYPIDASYRVEGAYELYAEPRPVLVPSSQGPDQSMLVPGRVHFTLRGTTCSLEPLVSSLEDDQLMFVFRDATSGRTTYGAGRFLYAPVPRAGSDTLVLDFNTSYNPPCAFTAYATCPLPPPGNTLSVAVEAGEKDYAAH